MTLDHAVGHGPWTADLFYHLLWLALSGTQTESDAQSVGARAWHTSARSQLEPVALLEPHFEGTDLLLSVALLGLLPELTKWSIHKKREAQNAPTAVPKVR